MPTITFDAPQGALSALRLSRTEFVKEMRVAAALLWYSHGELSQSKVAEIQKAVYVLHAFHKKAPSGIRTEKWDDLVAERLKTAQT